MLPVQAVNRGIKIWPGHLTLLVADMKNKQNKPFPQSIGKTRATRAVSESYTLWLVLLLRSNKYLLTQSFFLISQKAEGKFLFEVLFSFSRANI